MKTFLLYLLAFILCIIGFWLIDIAFPGMNTQQTIALALALAIFDFYFRLLIHINDLDDER